ncbi:FlgD immunoglobulin-like domain containing protein [Clostridium sp. ZS2-4]|uniref:FlgD immunoglobulin-like domain containing protein n=1 Tax=Clostridium sp. ZS2-4 TaxID=2987703 RepID=UPI00227B43B1|nr:FlgD immunoglobulin-like domain containing protein [Clostridium sp. ZS2-4]MCY6355125.1 hypothetical protein [Clostridium sp. ZS2-4]
MRKIKSIFNIILAIIVIFISCTSSFYAVAETAYPLDDGEIILEKQVYEDKIELFTEKQGKYFKKHIQKKNNKWEVIDNEEITLNKTGLKTDRNAKTDKNLKTALENKLRANGYELEELPSSLDYSDSPYLPAIGKQNENSCVAWSTGYYLRTYQQAMDIGWKIKDGDSNVDNHVFSPSFIYNQINEGVDEGADLQDAGELLTNIGAATLDNFPYIPEDYTTQPSYSVIQKAALNKIKSWRVLYTNNDSPEYIVQKTREYLNTGDLVVVGLSIGFKFQYPYEATDGTNIITTEEYTNGGHAVAIVGYDDNLITPDGKGAFKIINSWGENWGNNGFCYVTYENFVRNMRLGCVFTDLVNGRIVDDIQDIQAEAISPNEVKFTWDKPVNASGYKVLDENFNVLANVYDNTYIEKLDTPKEIKRYVQAFNAISTSNVVSATIDTNDIIEEILPLDTNDSVDFNINFSGSGKYTVKIKDNEGNLIKEEKDLQSKSGLNEYNWDGTDKDSKIAVNGAYKLELITDNSSKPCVIDFRKDSTVKQASAKKYKLNDETISIKIDATSKIDGKVNVRMYQNGEVKDLISGDSIKENETKEYLINKDELDLNNEDIKIEVSVY